MKLIDYLPFFYGNSEEVSSIQNSIDIEKIQLENRINELLEQLIIDTATWGLDYYERMLGLTTDKTQSYIDRRARIKMRLRSQGSATKKSIKNICKSFINGEIDIIEDSNNYRITIKFIGEEGIPANLDYLRDSLQQALPCHLKLQFGFSYLILKEVESMTLNDLEQTSLASFGM